MTFTFLNDLELRDVGFTQVASFETINNEFTEQDIEILLNRYQEDDVVLHNPSTRQIS